MCAVVICELVKTIIILKSIMAIVFRQEPTVENGDVAEH